MKEEFWDKDLGTVLVVRNSRARRLIARRKDEGIHLTVPVNYPLAKIKEVFNELKPRLLELKPKVKQCFDESTQLETLTFRLKIQKHSTQNYYVNLANDVLNIVCPENCDFLEDIVQLKIKTYIEKVLRSEAKRVFTPKLEILSKQNNFLYSGLKINKSRTRWGSCSSHQSINLSMYCMFLPEHLLDFVILHELCHTVEMNHSHSFWALLDKVTDDKAKQLTKELKNVIINW